MTLRGTYRKHTVIDDFGFYGSHYISSSIRNLTGELTLGLADKIVTSFISDKDTYYNDNVLDVMCENSEDLEFGGYNPLCDTAVYYFTETGLEYEDDLEDEEEYEDDEDDYDVLDEYGLDFWAFCDSIGIRLKPIDCLPED
jgi:hypothetical protein